MSEDQVFQLVALVAILLFIGSGALPLTQGQRRVVQGGAIAVVAVGVIAALALFVAS